MRPAPVAVLPMYDRPELRAATDRFWALLRDRLRGAGMDAPDALDRAVSPVRAWLDPGLVLGQTCGLPYARHLAGRVELVGAPDYRVEGCPPGHYASLLAVRADEPRGTLADFAGATAAVNELGSQSGHAALLHAAAPHARDGRFFGRLLLTGSHAGSIAALARGAADIAAIDAVSWRLAGRHDRAAAGLRVLARTAPTPCLPFITAAGNPAETVADVCAAAIGELDPSTRSMLGLHGFVRFRPEDYAPLAARLAAAEARLVLPAPDRDPPRHESPVLNGGRR